MEGTSKKEWTTHYRRGTPCYRAPELLRHRKYNNKVDIFAFGCILYEATFDVKAFSDDFSIVQYANTGSGLEYPMILLSERDERNIKEVKKIIDKTLTVDPSERPKARELHQILLDLATIHSQEPNPDGETLCTVIAKLLAQKCELKSHCSQEEVLLWNDQRFFPWDESWVRKQR